MQTNLAEAMGSLPPMPARTKRVVLLNGPPRCGKDTAAMGLVRGLQGICVPVHHKFATPLAAGVQGIFGVSRSRWDYLYATAKETPTPELLGMSPREAMIWLSEEVMKPKFGKDVFGRIAAEQIAMMKDAVVVISDCGFAEEIIPVAREVGWENILIVNIYRPGCTYASDSRSYITPDLLYAASAENPDPTFVQPDFLEVVNRKDIFAFRDEVIDGVTRWLA